jgi:membrane protein DedA with SNARE-associated domain
LVISYAFIPIPSNQVYMAIGMSHSDIGLFASTFFFGRIFSYAFWVAAANRFQDSIGGIFLNHFENQASFFIDILGILVLWLLSRIPWRHLLAEKSKGKD